MRLNFSFMPGAGAQIMTSEVKLKFYGSGSELKTTTKEVKFFLL